MTSRFARPYAQALLKTLDNEAAQRARSDLRNFAEAMDKVPALARMAQNPGIPLDAKKQVVREVSVQLGLEERTRDFLDLLTANYRLTGLPEILVVVDELLDRRLGIVKARVSAAHELDARQRERLTAVLERKLSSRVELEVTVSPELLGGFVVLVGSDRYDVSLRGQLDRLNTLMAEADADQG